MGKGSACSSRRRKWQAISLRFMLCDLIIEAFERLGKEFEAVGGREVQLRHEAFDVEEGLEWIHVRRESPRGRVRIHDGGVE